jgi:integrase
MEPSTITCYNSHINRHMIPALGDCPMREITTGKMTDFFDSLYGKLKESTIANIYRLLNLMFDIALDYDLVESKPLREKLHKPEFEREEKPTLPAEAARRLLKGLSYGERLFIAVLSVLTIRVNEGAALRWMNIGFNNGILSLTHGVWRRRLKPSLKTKASRRKFELPERLLVALQEWRSQSQFNKDEDFIFANSVGNQLDPDSFRKRVLYPLMDSLEIKRGSHTHGFHILRPTAATVLHELTGDIEKAQRALGHAHRSTTESFYDHAENVVDAQTTVLLLDWLVGQEHELLQQRETIN